MRRITVEEVKAAYERTGYKVLEGDYVLKHEGEVATCPLATLVCVATEKHPLALLHTDIQRELRISEAYQDGFVRAFDGKLWAIPDLRYSYVLERSVEDARELLRGARDGLHVRRHVPPEINALDFVPF